MSTDFTWHILGGGALGCLLAARLQLAGAEPRLILRDEAAVAAARSEGVRLAEEGVGFPASTQPTEVARSGWHGDGIRVEGLRLYAPAQLRAPLDRLILCTKAQQSLDALTAISARLQPDAHIVLMQNGMGVRDQLLAKWPGLTVVHGITTEGAWRKGRFHIVHAARGETLLGGTGELTPATAALLEQLAQNLRSAGFATRVQPDCRFALWEKLVVNSVLNPLTALHRCRNGETPAIPGVAATIQALCEEAAAVAQAAGVAMDAAALEQRVLQVRQATAANRSSMLQDVLAGRPTEIDFINGYIVREAARYGIAVPTQEAMWRAVLAIIDSPAAAP